MATSSSSYNSPCAACKYLRRRCMPGCIFAPYFPPEEPQKLTNVHKIFGASNVTKLLNELLPHQREDAVNSLAYEAEARVRDPVYGCVGAITFLQRQVQRLQKELDAANADLLHYACNEISPLPSSLAMPPLTPLQQRNQFGARSFGNEGSGLCRQSPITYSFPYSLPWNDTSLEDSNEGGGGEVQSEQVVDGDGDLHKEIVPPIGDFRNEIVRVKSPRERTTLKSPTVGTILKSPSMGTTSAQCQDSFNTYHA